MKKKSVIISVIVMVICSMCFGIAAYGGDYDTPIIPIPGNSASQGGSSEDNTDGNWETPPVDVSSDSSTDDEKEPVAISKCTFSKIANVTYSGKATKPSPTVKYSGKTLKKDTDYTLKYANNVKVGTATVTVTGKGDYTGTKRLTFKITKANNPITAKGKTATVKYSKLKKKNQTVERKNAITVSKAQGTVTYTKSSGNKKITINKKTGKINIKKGLKKGTYKVKIKVKAAGNASYKAATKTVTVTIKVK